MFINGEEFRARIRCWLLTFLFIDIEVLRTMRRKPKKGRKPNSSSLWRRKLWQSSHKLWSVRMNDCCPSTRALRSDPKSIFKLNAPIRRELSVSSMSITIIITWATFVSEKSCRWANRKCQTLGDEASTAIYLNSIVLFSRLVRCYSTSLFTCFLPFFLSFSEKSFKIFSEWMKLKVKD